MRLRGGVTDLRVFLSLNRTLILVSLHLMGVFVLWTVWSSFAWRSAGSASGVFSQPLTNP